MRSLLTSARQACSLAYAPYSHYPVGAAVLLADGTIVQGANQENASYPCGLCAERAALATAQCTHPDVPVVAIALSTPDPDAPITPCGMCRQALAETEQRYRRPITVVMPQATAHSIAELLPAQFKLAHSVN